MITDYSFRVPLLFFAPQVLDSTVTLSTVTSSIDLAPSVAELLGVDRTTVLEQGNTLWDPQLRTRRTFMLAKTYLGADIYHEDSTFLGWNSVTRSGCMSRDNLVCGPSESVPADRPLSDSIRTRISALTSTQLAWLDRFVAPQPSVP